MPDEVGRRKKTTPEELKAMELIIAAQALKVKASQQHIDSQLRKLEIRRLQNEISSQELRIQMLKLKTEIRQSEARLQELQ